MAARPRPALRHLNTHACPITDAAVADSLAYDYGAMDAVSPEATFRSAVGRIVETRYVHSVLAVARHGSFTRAASEQHMAVSTISRHVAAVERELGAAVFLRQAGRVHLTSAGRAFLPEAERIIATVDAALAKVRRVAKGHEGRPLLRSEP